jgi:predicted porin
MKKHLLGTTALVAAGMFAMVDTAYAQAKVEPVKVTVGGYFGEFVTYTDQDDFSAVTAVAGDKGRLTQLDEWSDKEIHFNGRTVLDNGMTVGFRLELEGNTESDQIDETFLFMEGRFGRLELGSTNNVHYKMAYKAPDAHSRGFGGSEGNHGNVIFNPTGSPYNDSMINTTVSRFRDNDSEKISYFTPRFEGFQLGASYIPNSSQDTNGAPEFSSSAYSRGWAVAANFVRSFGAFDVAAYGGYMTWQGPDLTATTSAPDPDQYSFGLQVGFAGFRVGGSYGKLSDGRTGGAGTAAASAAGTGAFRAEGRAFDVGVMYSFGPAAISLTYLDGENDDNAVTATTDAEDKFSLISLAGRYSIGPGVSLEAVLFHGKLEGNTSTGGATSNVETGRDNKATGALAGILLVF